MLIEKIYRILDVFQFMADGWIYPANLTEKEMQQIHDDATVISQRYNDTKWKMGFGEAMRLSKSEFMQKILEPEVKE